MSSTNKTANYELSQFVGTDIPSILGDYNGDMRKIDAAIGEVASSAGSSASAVSALSGRVTTVENNIQTLEGAQTVTNQRSVQNQVAITAIQGEIPEEASSENKLVTETQLDEVSANSKAVDLRLQDVEAIIPSNASTSNKLATMSDIPSAPSEYGIVELVTIPTTGLSTLADSIEAMNTTLENLNYYNTLTDTFKIPYINISGIGLFTPIGIGEYVYEDVLAVGFKNKKYLSRAKINGHYVWNEDVENYGSGSATALSGSYNEYDSISAKEITVYKYGNA